MHKIAFQKVIISLTYTLKFIQRWDHLNEHDITLDIVILHNNYMILSPASGNLYMRSDMSF